MLLRGHLSYARMTEAVPIPIASMMPLVLFPLLRIATADEVAKWYWNDTVFLYAPVRHCLCVCTLGLMAHQIYGFFADCMRNGEGAVFAKHSKTEGKKKKKALTHCSGNFTSDLLCGF